MSRDKRRAGGLNETVSSHLPDEGRNGLVSGSKTVTLQTGVLPLIELMCEFGSGQEEINLHLAV